MRVNAVAVRGVAIGLLLAVSAGAGAREVHVADSTIRITTKDIDLGNVHVHSSLDGDRKMHLKGNVTVNGQRSSFDDTVIVNIPRVSVTRRLGRGGNVDLGPGIHIESDDESIVRMGSDIDIDSTEVVEDDVVALFGNVTVRGHVNGDVVAVLGSVRLEPGAVVEGDAVAVGGSLDQSSDASVHGKSVSLSFLPMRDGMPPLRALAVAVFALWIVAMLMGALLILMFPRKLETIAHTVSERTGWSLLFGLLLPPLAVIAAVLLIVTMIGIPVAVLLPLAYVFVMWVGTVAATSLLGARLLRRPIGGGMAGSLFAGLGMLGVLFGLGAAFAGAPGWVGTLALFCPLLGLLLVMSLAVVGSGAVLVSRFGTVPNLGAPPQTDAPRGESGPVTAPASS